MGVPSRFRLSTCRRSRFCAYETCSVFRCPFVLYRVHYPPYIEESVRLPNWAAAYFFFPHQYGLCVFRCRHFRYGLTDVALTSCENLGLAIDQLHLYPLCGLLAHRTCRSAEYIPSSAFRFNDMLLSTIVFRLRVSHCPRGLYSLSLPCFTDIPYAPTRRTILSQLPCLGV